MSWLKNIFGNKMQHDANTEPKEIELLSRLEESINQCNNDIKNAETEIDQIKKWSSEAIRETYEVPGNYLYEELSKFDEIKLLEKNKLTDLKVITKCDEIIDAYLEQIKLREAKISLYNSLIVKYQQSQNKMYAIKKRRDEDIASCTKLEALEKHKQRIEQMVNNPDNTNVPIEETNQLDIIKYEANEVFEEFEINEEVRADLEEINKKFKSGNLSANSKMAIEKIESLSEKIKLENRDLNE